MLLTYLALLQIVLPILAPILNCVKIKPIFLAQTDNEIFCGDYIMLIAEAIARGNLNFENFRDLHLSIDHCREARTRVIQELGPEFFIAQLSHPDHKILASPFFPQLQSAEVAHYDTLLTEPPKHVAVEIMKRKLECTTWHQQRALLRKQHTTEAEEAESTTSPPAKASV